MSNREITVYKLISYLCVNSQGKFTESLGSQRTEVKFFMAGTTHSSQTGKLHAVCAETENLSEQNLF